MKRQRQKKGYNYHHIKPRSQGGSDLDSNMCFIKMSKHNAWHRMFGNSTPKQVDTMLRNFEKDFEEVFGKVTYKEAAEIVRRLLRIKGWTL